MAKITLFQGEHSQILESLTGETLHQTMTRYGIFHPSPCGGQKLCKQCKVVVRGQTVPVAKEEYEYLTDDQLLKGVRFCCMAVPTGDCTVFLDADSGMRQEPVATTACLPAAGKHGYGLGIDIGTTTLAVYLYSGVTGALLEVASAQNQQAAFGDDVISRIEAVTALKALPKLQQSVTGQLSRLIEQVCQRAHIAPDAITSCAVAANTTMLHLLVGLDPTAIGKAPFTPLSLFGTMYRGEQLNLPLTCQVYLIPCISAYVGGDITAGIAACEMDRSPATQLLIDVGTNGEMALAHNGQIYCLATAAGPAFEGAHIQNGVGGIAGAVCKISQAGYETIENAPAVGICGSGLLDAIALMLEQNVLDETGYLAEPYLLIPNTSLTITPKDIREIQLAKSAIGSGILRLCELAGIAPEQIDKVYFAGGFGSRLNPQSASAIGLIPQLLTNKCVAAGNTAGLGAAKAALDSAFLERLETIARQAVYFELSGDARFNDLFIENMLLEG